ncbi:MAG: RHS repeat-associated core domain-containing protein [Sedimentisphaerales bacterium]|nr:RHS repeat-associated core domain-containing protein [Sedimentisphaerales bacterium]
MANDKMINYNGSMLASYKYDELSRRTCVTYGSDANAVYAYDLGDRLTQLKNKFNSSQTQTIGYTSYDNVGNRKNMVVDSDESKYYYDNRYQLIFADYPAVWNVYDVNYFYDNIGNRRGVKANGSTTMYLHNKLNQYYSVSSVAYSYDASGNLTNDGTWKYTYDIENRLTEVKNQSDSTIATYAYDYLGKRISKTVSGTTTKYVYDGDQIIAEYNGSTLLRKYVYGLFIDEPVCMIIPTGTQAGTYYYHFDGLGSVVALTDSSGAIVEKYRYDVFGNTTILSPSDQTRTTSNYANRFMFTGREYDTETDNYSYRARYYRPSLGRFLQTDPIRYKDGQNFYVYVKNNPIMAVDPFGLLAWPGCPSGPWINGIDTITGKRKLRYYGYLTGVGSENISISFCSSKGRRTTVEALILHCKYENGRTAMRIDFDPQTFNDCECKCDSYPCKYKEEPTKKICTGTMCDEAGW